MYAADWKVRHRESGGVPASEQPEENFILYADCVL